MKKYMLFGFGLLLFLFSESAAAQIVGRDDRPVRKDTVMHPQKPVVRDTAVWQRRDTVWRPRTDAERRQDSIKWRRRTDSVATAVKHKTAEVAAKVGAAVRDCSLKNVKGPHGETVYVDEYDRRYYINKEGTKVYLKRPASGTDKK